MHEVQNRGLGISPKMKKVRRKNRSIDLLYPFLISHVSGHMLSLPQEEGGLRNKKERSLRGVVKGYILQRITKKHFFILQKQ